MLTPQGRILLRKRGLLTAVPATGPLALMAVTTGQPILRRVRLVRAWRSNALNVNFVLPGSRGYRSGKS